MYLQNHYLRTILSPPDKNPPEDNIDEISKKNKNKSLTSLI